MLAELVHFEQEATLIARTGIQFVDIGLALKPKEEEPGQFARQPSPPALVRLELAPRSDDRYVDPANPGTFVRPKFDLPIEESLQLLDGCWLPLPYLRVITGGASAKFSDGPTTWARARLVRLSETESQEDRHHTHRLTLAFDTNLLDNAKGTAYLAPTTADVQARANFRLAHRSHQMVWFVITPWVSEWLEAVFRENAGRIKLHQDDVASELGELRHHAHYMNWLALIGARGALPDIVVRPNGVADASVPIPVDMVLDVGNSRTCGIMIEHHPQQDHGLKNRYELTLRDLSAPHRVYNRPFESRVEFGEVNLGRSQIASHSGRNDAFVWPTLARIGPEAAALANRRRGTEGSTGLSSPKRYLWDESRYQPGWRSNLQTARIGAEPFATGAPFSNLINEQGEPLYDVAILAERTPVFRPHYSRSSMMMFMLTEVFAHALAQMNSTSQRLKQGSPKEPRYIRSIILTIPPSMPTPERDIFAKRAWQAIVLIWKALGWHPEDDEPPTPTDAPEEGSTQWPPFPRIFTDWDEASCAQIVYLFSEITAHFSGRSDDFFAALRRRPDPGGERKITLASLDIGGGTTDLVVTDFSLSSGSGAHVYIRPRQRFRDGFKVAGDDLLLEIVKKTVVPALESALESSGAPNPSAVLSQLIGSEVRSAQDKTRRQQLALQMFYPLGLKILAEYEAFDPKKPPPRTTRTVREWLVGREPPSDEVLRYFSDGVSRFGNVAGGGGFNLLDVPITIDFAAIHRWFLDEEMDVCKKIAALCDIVHLYECDALLLTGRPSLLPGVQAMIRARLPVPPDRMVPLHRYRAGPWYPFHRDGRIDDPKTTAAVGAMVCRVSDTRELANFFVLANELRGYSTVRFIGSMDYAMTIKDREVYYREVDLDDPDYELPETPFELRGSMALGYRQIDSERWGASPLYLLELSDRLKKTLGDDSLNVTLKRGRKERESFEVASVSAKSGRAVRPSDVSISLYTLPRTAALAEPSYWLDTGSII